MWWKLFETCRNHKDDAAKRFQKCQRNCQKLYKGRFACCGLVTHFAHCRTLTTIGCAHQTLKDSIYRNFLLHCHIIGFNGNQIVNQSGCDKNPLKWKLDLLIENTKTIKVQLFFIGITDFNSLQINEWNMMPCFDSI